MTTTPNLSDDSFSSPLLSAEQAGRYLRRDWRTLANWRVKGYGPKWIRIGRSAFYRVEALDAWLDSQTFQHNAEERVRRESAAVATGGA